LSRDRIEPEGFSGLGYTADPTLPYEEIFWGFCGIRIGRLSYELPPPKPIKASYERARFFGEPRNRLL